MKALERHPGPWCDECRKVKYPTKKRAERAVDAMRREGDYGMSAYKCSQCGAFHIGHSHNALRSLFAQIAAKGKGRV